MNDCQCTIPDGGFCDRHKLQKSANWVHLCRTNASYWKAWEEGGGPGRNIGDGQSESRPAQPAAGPGTELRKILGCCNCSFAARMNEWGPDGCLERIDEIIGWLTESGKMSDQAARRMITLAVERARSVKIQAAAE